MDVLIYLIPLLITIFLVLYWKKKNKRKNKKDIYPLW